MLFYVLYLYDMLITLLVVMHVCMYKYIINAYYLLLYHVRVTNITINEVDQPLISNVIEVCTYMCSYVLHIV